MVRSPMLLALLAGALALGACGARHGSGPAWPKTAAAETDGGESLAPREPAAIAVADASDDDEDDEPAATAPPATVVPGSPAATPAAASATPAAPEEPITVEEIVIEIDDD